MIKLKLTLCFSKSIDSLKGLVVLIQFQHVNLKDNLIKVFCLSDNSLAPSLNHIGFRTSIFISKFDGQCLKQGKVTFNYKTVVDIFIVCEINLWPFKQRADFMIVSFVCLELFSLFSL